VSASILSLTTTTTTKSRLQFEIKYDLHKIAYKRKNLKTKK